MNPYKLREIYKYLTRAKKADPSLPDVFSASKAPIPAKTQNVEEIEAINQFMLRNPRVEKAGGGMLVQPSDDGSRPGYMGKNVMSGSPAQQAENIRRQNESFKKISDLFKNKDYTSLKLATRPARIEAGTQQDTGGKLNTNQQKQIKEAIEGGDKTQKTFAKKLNISQKEFLEGIKKSKSKISLEKSESMKKMRFTPDVQLQQKMFYEILENPNATVQSMAKKFKVAEKEITKKSSQLLKNVYTQNVAITKTPAFDIDSRGKATLKSWLPDQYESTKNFLNNFSDINGLKKVQTENMGILLANAYRDQPKKYADAMKTLTAYNDFKNSLPKGLKVDLDHPLSKEFIKGSPLSKADPSKLLYVSPVDRNFNRGFKKQIGDRYAKALLRGDKTAIKNIRTLADKVGVNIGDVKGSKLTFGTSKFDKNKNFALEYFKNLKEQNLVADNLKNLQKTKEGKQLIKDANFKQGQIKPITKVDKKTSKALQSFFKRNGIKCNLANGINCGQPEAYVKSINELKAKAAAGDKAAAKKLVEVTKGMSKGGKLLRSLIGPGAILFEPVYEGVVAANKVLDGKPLNQAWAESYLSYLDSERVDPKTLKREEMLYRQIEGPERKVKGGQGTVTDKINIDAGGASKLRPLFAAEDTMAAFEKAKKEKRRGEFISRKDIENKAAADIRDMRKTGSINFAQQTINDPATQEALSKAQEYIAAKRGAASSIPQSAMADERRRREAMKADGMLTIEDAKNELQDMGDYYGQGYTPFGLNKLFEEAGMQNPGYGITKVGPATGKYNQAQGLQDYLNSMRMQNIADAGGVANMAGGGIAGLSGGDKSGRPPESGPASQGLRSLFNNGKKR